MKLKKGYDEVFGTFFKATLETQEDCEFIEYLEKDIHISIGGKSLTIIGNEYRIMIARGN